MLHSQPRLASVSALCTTGEGAAGFAGAGADVGELASLVIAGATAAAAAAAAAGATFFADFAEDAFPLVAAGFAVALGAAAFFGGVLTGFVVAALTGVLDADAAGFFAAAFAFAGSAFLAAVAVFFAGAFAAGASFFAAGLPAFAGAFSLLAISPNLPSTGDA